MTLWVLIGLLLALVVALARVVRVRVDRRGIGVFVRIGHRTTYLGRMPDGTWQRLTIGPPATVWGWPTEGDQPPDSGVRQPRPPAPPDPRSAIALDLHNPNDAP